MKVAYIDTSAFLEVFFREQGAKNILRAISKIQVIISSDLLVAEAAAASVRENLELETLPQYLDRVTRIVPEITFDLASTVLKHGYVRGADLYHLAAACWFCGDARRDALFVSRDKQQNLVAAKLGFNVI